MAEAPNERMFIGQSVESVDRGVVSTGQLFIARRPDSPYLVPGVDIEFVRSDIADRDKRERDMLFKAAKKADEVLDDLCGWLGEPQPDDSIGERDVAAFKALRAAIAECGEKENAE